MVAIASLFIHSFPAYLLSSYYGPLADLDAGDTLVNKIDKNPALSGLCASQRVKGSGEVNKLIR